MSTVLAKSTPCDLDEVIAQGIFIDGLSVKETDRILSFYRDVIAGLSSSQKQLSPKYFYDAAGSQYFDAICHLEEYYPYRTELALLPEVASSLSELLDEHYAIIEFGAGSLDKISPFLEKVKNIERFIPIDISGDHLRSSVEQLQSSFPEIEMIPIEADFTQHVELPALEGLTKLGFFPGSTIGNFHPDQARDFLENAAKTLGKSAYMVVGVDTKKPPELLHNAYNDTLNITKKFNLNVLTRINQELSGNFDLSNFEHYAFYNPVKGCIEMHLVSQCDQVITVGSHEFSFSDGESIHTESSYKYTQEGFRALAGAAGWQVEKIWMAPEDMFSIFLIKVC